MFFRDRLTIPLRQKLDIRAISGRLRGSKVHRKLKHSLNALLGKMGYQLQRSERLKPVDLRDKPTNPLLFRYYGGQRPVLMGLPIERGIGLDVFPLADPADHPFVQAGRQALDSEDPTTEIHRVLNRYYEMVQPQSAAEWLGFRRGQIPALDDQPPWARVLPWQSTDILARRRRVQLLSPIESHNVGESAFIDRDGWRTYGPVSDLLLDVETRRLHQLLESIHTRGYQRTDSEIGDISATVLWASEDQWKWKITGGEHRTAVLGALEYDRIPVRITQLIRRADVEVWPNVDSGLYDKDQALALFDRLLQGQLPPVVPPSSWAEADGPPSPRDRRVYNY